MRLSQVWIVRLNEFTVDGSCQKKVDLCERTHYRTFLVFNLGTCVFKLCQVYFNAIITLFMEPYLVLTEDWRNSWTFFAIFPLKKVNIVELKLNLFTHRGIWRQIFSSLLFLKDPGSFFNIKKILNSIYNSGNSSIFNVCTGVIWAQY